MPDELGELISPANEPATDELERNDDAALPAGHAITETDVIAYYRENRVGHPDPPNWKSLTRTERNEWRLRYLHAAGGGECGIDIPKVGACTREPGHDGEHIRARTAATIIAEHTAPRDDSNPVDQLDYFGHMRLTSDGEICGAQGWAGELNYVCTRRPGHAGAHGPIPLAGPRPADVSGPRLVTRAELTALINHTFAAIVELDATKGREYAGDADALGNFNKRAAELDLRPMQVWGIFAGKHWDAIMSFIRRGEVLSEPIEGRIDDAILYLILLKGLIRQSSDNVDKQDKQE